jgi:hypothetical protein
MATRLFLAICLMLSAASRAAADRAAELKKLVADYEAELKEFYDRDVPGSPAGKIDWYKSYPRWKYLPRIVALAEADPTDVTALEACKVIVGQNGQINIGCEWKPLFDAEKMAWRIIKEQQLTEKDCSELCLIAAFRRSPTREAFLREMASRANLPGQARAFATLGLAEYLAGRSEDAEVGGYAAWWSKPENEYFAFLRTQLADEWIKYATVVDPESFRAESIDLFRRVLKEYADVPVTITAPRFGNWKTIGDKSAEESPCLGASLHWRPRARLRRPRPRWQSPAAG